MAEFPTEEEHKRNLVELETWDFFVWDFSSERRIRFAMTMYESLGLLSEFAIPPDKFVQFFASIFATSHDDVPYHNKQHYYAVLHTCWMMVRLNNLASVLTKLDLLALLTSAIGHDADHPGLSNPFLAASSHRLAVLYNDQSVLENHHAAVTFAVLLQDKSNLFVNLAPKDYRAVRKFMIAAVLYTDMAKHFTLIKTFTEAMVSLGVHVGGSHSADGAAASGPRPAPQTTPLALRRESVTEDVRSIMVSMLLHCADISNGIKPWRVCKRFADELAAEFTAQVTRERAEGLPVSQHMANLDEMAMQAKGEIGFINVFTWPSMVALSGLMPNMQECFEHMETNRQKWHALET